MKKIAITLAISLLPITAMQPAEARVCGSVLSHYKKSTSKAGPTVVGVYKRVCSR